MLEKIRNLFGGNLRVAVTGAAPINPDILRFFDAAGVLVLEGWGMTETSTAATIATPDDFKFGTIGKPLPGVEVKIADDGEILVKGPNIFQGYYKNDEATSETLVDGWLHTGDLGEVDSDGYLKITGRKKDIIITAGGKNITPANLEAEIKQHPLVSQCVVVGDRRPYLVCVVTLDPEEAQKLAAEKGLDAATLHENDEVRASIQAHLDQINQKFARVEQVKKFAILPAGPLTRGRRAHADDEDQAERGRREVRRARSSRSTRADSSRRFRRSGVGGFGVCLSACAETCDPVRMSADVVCSRTRRQPARFSSARCDLLHRVADAALRDLDSVALCDRPVAVVVAGQLERDRLEAVLGDVEARLVVEDRGAEHQRVVELGLDQDDVDARIALLPDLDRAVEAVVGHHPEDLVADAGEAHVGDVLDAGPRDRGDRLAEVVHVGDERVDHDDELGARARSRRRCSSSRGCRRR